MIQRLFSSEPHLRWCSTELIPLPPCLRAGWQIAPRLGFSGNTFTIGGYPYEPMSVRITTLRGDQVTLPGCLPGQPSAGQTYTCTTNFPTQGAARAPSRGSKNVSTTAGSFCFKLLPGPCWSWGATRLMLGPRETHSAISFMVSLIFYSYVKHRACDCCRLLKEAPLCRNICNEGPDRKVVILKPGSKNLEGS